MKKRKKDMMKEIKKYRKKEGRKHIYMYWTYEKPPEFLCELQRKQLPHENMRADR
jgi:hypothetical protein